MQVADLLRNIKNTNLRKNDIVCVALVKTVNVGNLPFANVLTLPRRLRDLSPPPVAPNFHIVRTILPPPKVSMRVNPGAD